MEYFFSEKDRKVDYNDCLVELWSKFPYEKGWIHQNKAQYLVYFVPNYVYIIDFSDLRKLVLDLIFKEIKEVFFDEMLQKLPYQSASKKINISLNGELEIIKLITAYNKINNDSWYTTSICLGYDLLKKYGVRFKKYSLEL